jgi:hypothetical protein
MLGCTRLLFVKIGSNFFCHGGLIKQFIDDLKHDGETHYDTLKRVNDLFKKWLITGESNDETKKIINAMNDEHSILWTRIFGQIKNDDSTNECQKHLYPIMEMMKINSMIVGHTPQIFINGDSINSTCNKKLWRIDNALSEAFDEIIKIKHKNHGKRKIQLLEILNDNEFNIISS